eukprot:2286698-Pleurochrysis_carterae.AAC.3
MLTPSSPSSVGLPVLTVVVFAPVRPGMACLEVAGEKAITCEAEQQFGAMTVRCVPHIRVNGSWAAMAATCAAASARLPLRASRRKQTSR